MIKRRSLVIALSPLLAGAVFQGVSATGVSSGREQALPDWSDCSSVVAYWDLNETGTSDRSSDAGSCGSDCTLSAETGVSSTTGVRGNAVEITASTEFLSCADATCDELDFSAEDFSLSGWITSPDPALVGTGAGDYAQLIDNLASSSGYETRNRAFRLFSAFAIANGYVDTAAVTADTAGLKPLTDQLNYFGMSWDESEGNMLVCQGDRFNETIACRSVATGESVSAATQAFKLCTATQNATVSCDEVQVLSAYVSETDQCRICSCWLDGSGCTRIGKTFANTGLNATHCGHCDLPTDASTTCPS